MGSSQDLILVSDLGLSFDLLDGYLLQCGYIARFVSILMFVYMCVLWKVGLTLLTEVLIFLEILKLGFLWVGVM